MESLTANEAKTHFGDLLLKAQREPVQINRNGKAVAVILSMDTFALLETLKMQQLKARIQQAKNDIAKGNILDGHDFFGDLLDGKFD